MFKSGFGLFEYPGVDRDSKEVVTPDKIEVETAFARFSNLADRRCIVRNSVLVSVDFPDEILI